MLRTLRGLVYRYPATDVELAAIDDRLLYEGEIDQKEKMAAIQIWTKEVESRSSIYLGHISIMIAVAGIFTLAPSIGDPVRMAFGFELIAYLILALFSIRCQLHIGVLTYAGLKPLSEQYTPQEVEGHADIETIGMSDTARLFYYLTPKSRTIAKKEERFETLLKCELIFREKLSKMIVVSLYAMTISLILLIGHALGIVSHVVDFLSIAMDLP